MSQRPLRIGITCYPTIGGSGTIASEIGLGLARRGHQVHFICYDTPSRLRPVLEAGTFAQHLHFHRVEVNDYPLQHLGPYPLALASSLAQLSRQHLLELIHVHYSVPHTTSAYLARQLLLAQGAPTPQLVTTLHGTDITLVGSDPSLLPIHRFSLLHSDGITVPSAYLRQAAYDNLKLPTDKAIEVVPNFVDAQRFAPAPRSSSARWPDAAAPKVLCHSSNFRPLKRIEDVLGILVGVRKVLPAVLKLVGDGPERPRIEQQVRALGLAEHVQFLGVHADAVAVLQESDLFLLPSTTEGFGLAALEAQSCGVPVVASRVGGISEVISDGETGLLCEVMDVEAMTAAALRLLQDAAEHQRMSAAARARVLAHFTAEPLVLRYEAYYRRLLSDSEG